MARTWRDQYQTPPGWRAIRARVMRAHDRCCHVCGHGAADEVDHLVNVATWQRERRAGDPHQLGNLAPIHGAPCPECGRQCHGDKTARERQQGRDAWKRPAEIHPGMIGR